MPRTARKKSESGIYHVMPWGINRYSIAPTITPLRRNNYRKRRGADAPLILVFVGEDALVALYSFHILAFVRANSYNSGREHDRTVYMDFSAWRIPPQDAKLNEEEI
ncbi:MAG: hypothetical protein RRY64_06525 [Oscillospiraceae bacterium]